MMEGPGATGVFSRVPGIWPRAQEEGNYESEQEHGQQVLEEHWRGEPGPPADRGQGKDHVVHDEEGHAAAKQPTLYPGATEHGYQRDGQQIDRRNEEGHGPLQSQAERGGSKAAGERRGPEHAARDGLEDENRIPPVDQRRRPDVDGAGYEAAGNHGPDVGAPFSLGRKG